MCLQDSSHNGVWPEALGWTVLGLHLLSLGGWVWVTGIQHGLEDAPASVDKPRDCERERENERGTEREMERGGRGKENRKISVRET